MIEGYWLTLSHFAVSNPLTGTNSSLGNESSSRVTVWAGLCKEQEFTIKQTGGILLLILPCTHVEHWVLNGQVFSLHDVLVENHLGHQEVRGGIRNRHTQGHREQQNLHKKRMKQLYCVLIHWYLLTIACTWWSVNGTSLSLELGEQWKN